jgi:hypothetical protein
LLTKIEKLVATIHRAVGAILVMSFSNILDVVVADLVLGGQARLPGTVQSERRDRGLAREGLDVHREPDVPILLRRRP